LILTNEIDSPRVTFLARVDVANYSCQRILDGIDFSHDYLSFLSDKFLDANFVPWSPDRARRFVDNRIFSDSTGVEYP